MRFAGHRYRSCCLLTSHREIKIVERFPAFSWEQTIIEIRVSNDAHDDWLWLTRAGANVREIDEFIGECIVEYIKEKERII